MEESEKRRERLRAMRMEADSGVMVSATPTCSSSSSSSPSTLSNPLLERPAQDSNAPSRFGFYTDPMAAFSSDKRLPAPPHFAPRPHFPNVTGAQTPELPISGVHQFQNSYSPYQSVHQDGDSYCSPGPPASPMGFKSPYPVHQGTPNLNLVPGRGHWVNNSPGPGSSPYPVHQGSPNFRSPSAGRGYWHNSSPGFGPGSGHGGDPSPSIGRGTGQWDGIGSGGRCPSSGRGYGYNYSPGPGLGPGSGRGSGPSPSIGRGRGFWDGSGTSPASGHSGGRGRSFNANDRAGSFYHESMVLDPWESLTPVVWKSVNATWNKYKNFGSLQQTPTAKKPRVSAHCNTSNSKQSLAEFLAESFEEAVEDATTL